MPLPILNLPNEYANGGQMSWGSNTTLTIAAGQFRNSTNIYDITTPAATLNAAVVGLNGIDTGSLEVSTVYSVYAISDTVGVNPSGYILSLSATTPTLPFGYSAFRRIGVWPTDGSANFRVGFVAGNSNERKFYYETGVTMLTGGTATTPTLVDLSTVVPTAVCPVTFSCVFTPATAGHYTSIIPGSSSNTAATSVLSGSVAAVPQAANLETLANVVSSKAQIKYFNSNAAGSTTLYLLNFTYYI